MFCQISVRNIAWYLATIVLVTVGVASAATAQTYVQTNLVSDIPGRALTTDPVLTNPWGLARSSTSQWWVADNATGVSTIYNGAGIPAQNPPGTQFVVHIPTPNGTGTASPTGTISNSTADFHGGRFIFATEDGTISAWIPSINQFNAVLEVDQSSTAIFKGLTMSSFGGANYLYAADFHGGRVEVFDKDFHPFSFSSTAFTDPTIPDGFAPFNVQAIGAAIVVTFAKQDKTMSDDMDRKEFGFVDVFTPNGNLMMRLESGPWLNAPWGVALAPSVQQSFIDREFRKRAYCGLRCRLRLLRFIFASKPGCTYEDRWPLEPRVR